MTGTDARTPSSSPRRRRFLSVAVALAMVVGVFFGLTSPVAAAPKEPKGSVKLSVKIAKATYAVGERPVVRIKVKARSKGRAVSARGKVIVKALGKTKKENVRLRKGRAKTSVRLPELTAAGRVKVKVTFKGRKLPKRTVTKTFKVREATWQVPDAALRAQIRSALELPEDHALTLGDAADLNNTNGAALYFGDVRTAAGLEVATGLTELTSFTAGNAQDSRGLDNITRVNGEFWISNAVQDASYPRLAYIGDALQAFNIDAERIRSISMPALVDAKRVDISDRPQLTTVALPKLATVRGDVAIEDDPALTAVDLPALAVVGGRLDIEHLEVATAVRLPSLADTVDLNVSSLPRAQTLDLSRLGKVNDQFRIAELPLLGSLAAPALQQVGGDMVIYGLGSIAAFKMPALQWSHGAVTFGIGEDFAALPTDGTAVSFPAFDVTLSTNFGFSVRGLTNPQGSTPVERWNEFRGHFGVVQP